MNTLCESPPRSSTWPWHPPCGWSRSLQEDVTSFMLAFFDSRLAMAGVDLYTLQRAGGWKTQVMVQRYAHLSPDYIRAAVERLANPQSGSATGTKTGTDGIADTPESAQVPEKNGAPGRNRTPDPRLRRAAATWHDVSGGPLSA